MGELEFNRHWHHAKKVRAGQSPRIGRVVSGDCSPETPTEPDMQIFRIRLFGPRFRYATFAGRMRGSGNG
jgi:hypothetical protein